MSNKKKKDPDDTVKFIAGALGGGVGAVLGGPFGAAIGAGITHAAASILMGEGF
jgi:outer membrane lipoprotein SlyB